MKAKLHIIHLPVLMRPTSGGIIFLPDIRQPTKECIIKVLPDLDTPLVFSTRGVSCRCIPTGVIPRIEGLKWLELQHEERLHSHEEVPDEVLRVRRHMGPGLVPRVDELQPVQCLIARQLSTG